MSVREPYVPPLRYQWLTRFYDPIVRLTTREKTFKQALIRQLGARSGDIILDLGCGTATLAVALATTLPDVVVIGLDADARALALAQGKARRAGADVHFEQAYSSHMPFADARFDRVVSSLFFHHLSTRDKNATLSEVKRVLKPGGELHIADWGKAANLFMRTAFLFVQILDGFENTGDNARGLLPQMIKAAGFSDTRQTHAINTPLGTIELYRALRR
jgi:ubiquinone/menaquinone biosynthesis C-methylase UbiE